MYCLYSNVLKAIGYVVQTCILYVILSKLAVQVKTVTRRRYTWVSSVHKRCCKPPFVGKLTTLLCVHLMRSGGVIDCETIKIIRLVSLFFIIHYLLFICCIALQFVLLLSVLSADLLKRDLEMTAKVNQGQRSTMLSMLIRPVNKSYLRIMIFVLNHECETVRNWHMVSKEH